MEKPQISRIPFNKDRPPRLVVAVSSRALFDLSDSHKIFEQHGLEAFSRYQVRHEDDILPPGDAFGLVRKLLALNQRATDVGKIQNPGVEVILLSRNSADTGLRVFNSIEHYGLNIERAIFTSGSRPYRYMEAAKATLFLSTNADDVRNAINAGYAAATVLNSSGRHDNLDQLRIAFDGDAVLFSDEAERVYQSSGLDAFSVSEKQAAATPLQHGPFRTVLQALQQIQAAYPAEGNPVRTALVTARSMPAHKRVILTLRHWGIRVDESLFLGGDNKGPYLKAFGADIFFDDQTRHCDSAAGLVTTAHVPNGVMNQDAA